MMDETENKLYEIINQIPVTNKNRKIISEIKLAVQAGEYKKALAKLEEITDENREEIEEVESTDIKQIDTNKNLDEPSYKRKNIEIPVSNQEVKPKIFTKELELRENLIKKEKLEQEYKAYQNEILENKVKQEIKKLEEYDAINSSDIIEGNKYSFNSPKTIKTD